MVGTTGFEPATSRTPSVRATRLRYVPTGATEGRPQTHNNGITCLRGASRNCAAQTVLSRRGGSLRRCGTGESPRKVRWQRCSLVYAWPPGKMQLKEANLQGEFSRSAGAQPQDLLFGIALFTRFFVFARGGAFAVVALFQSLNEAKRRAIEIPLGAQLIFQEALEIEMQRLFLVGEEQENRRGYLRLGHIVNAH